MIDSSEGPAAERQSSMNDTQPSESARLAWTDLPQQVRDAIEAFLGSPVIATESQSGGYSPSLAARVATRAGRRAFVKATGPQPLASTPDILRREGSVAAMLPDSVPAPRHLWTYDEGATGWVALIYEEFTGRPPALPWHADELSHVLTAITELADVLTPSPIPASVIGTASARFAENRIGWRLLREEHPERLDAWSHRYLDQLVALESAAASVIEGNTLLHLDLRSDNFLLTGEGAVVVDWAWARVGAAWTDMVSFAPTVMLEGGPSPGDILRRFPLMQSVSAEAIDAVIAAETGRRMYDSLQPPFAGKPQVRSYQAALSAIMREWIAERTGWH